MQKGIEWTALNRGWGTERAIESKKRERPSWQMEMEMKNFVSAFVCCQSRLWIAFPVHSHFSNLLSPLSAYILLLDLFHFSHHLFSSRSSRNSSSRLIIIVICWASQLLPWRYEFVCECEYFESSVRHSYIHCWKSRKWTHVSPKLYCSQSSCVCVCTTHTIRCSHIAIRPHLTVYVVLILGVCNEFS